ncbi:hypothetical protein ACIPVB_13720 [Microbacterium sp. NPDC090007]|uniref:hypothetical protein n=1 Tax=Microbacterium sp. NPDC090007 TaxID=3364204 RepID=UPI0037F254E6
MTPVAIALMLLGGMFCAVGVLDVLAAEWFGWLEIVGGLLLLVGGIQIRRRP